MLYLIRSFTRTGSFLKVGYTGDIKQRMNQYLVENPGRELVSTREGGLAEETLSHLYLTACGVKADFLEEWFLDCGEVLTGFHQSWERMKRLVWRKRELLFTAFDFSRRSLKVQLYEDLRFQHRNEPLNILTIDKEWRQWNMKMDMKTRSRILNDEWIM